MVVGPARALFDMTSIPSAVIFIGALFVAPLSRYERRRASE
jgi:hypothetical protein